MLPCFLLASESKIDLRRLETLFLKTKPTKLVRQNNGDTGWHRKTNDIMCVMVM